MNPSVMDDMKSALFAKYNQPRANVHVSDLVWCARQSIARRLNPPPISNQDVSNFSRGEGMGAALQHLTKFHPGKYTIEKPFTFFELQAHVDLYNEVDDYPIEVKTYAGKTMAEPKAHYVEQLKTYMAITNKTQGLILVQCLTQFDEFPFIEFPISMDDGELKKRRENLFLDFRQYERAFNAKDPGMAKHVMFNENLNFKCTTCFYVKECQELNKDEIQERLKQGLTAIPKKPAIKKARVAVFAKPSVAPVVWVKHGDF